MTKPVEAKEPRVSLIVPVFNEASSIRDNLTQLLTAVDDLADAVELVVVDDGSIDDTAAELSRAAAADARIRPIHFTRNFGKEAAIHAGLTAARGDCAVVLDADLQHPPNLIPAMLSHWRQGFLVVEAIKTERGRESLAARANTGLFYWLFKHLAGMDIAGLCDFKLLDRRVIDTYLALPERRRFFRGLVYWSGYPTARIPFEVPPCESRRSRWSWLRLARYALDNLTSFSSLPLHLVGLLGAFTLGVGLVFGLLSLIQKLTGGSLDGFTTVILLIVIIGGALMISLGIIGHYLALLYDEVKGRPTYLLRPPPDRLAP
jgi:dolichol-phosphate mannosyltransferase